MFRLAQSLAAAPAADGAQGEVEAASDGACPAGVECFKANPEFYRCIKEARHYAPQPAAADGGVRDIVEAVDDPNGTCPTCYQYLRKDADHNLGEPQDAVAFRTLIDGKWWHFTANAHPADIGPIWEPLYASPQPALSSHRQAGDELPNQKAVELLRELRTARPLLLYGDAWIERIDSVLALIEKGAGNG